MIRLLGLVCGLSACSGDKDSSSDDSGIPGVGQALDTSDTGELGFVDRVTVVVEGEAEGLLVGVAQYWFDVDGLIAGSALSWNPVQDGSATLGLQTPDKSDLVDDGSGALMGTFAVFLRRDEDGDGIPDDDEPILGIAETRLLYVVGELEKESAESGMAEGWNAIWFPLEGEGAAVLHDLAAFPLEVNLNMTESLAFSGTSDVPEEAADPIRLTALPMEVEDSDDIWIHRVFDEQLSSTWATEVRGDPHESHVITEEGKLPSALEVPIAYLDIDESEDLNDGDEMLYGVCFEEQPLLLMWIDELTNLSDAITAPIIGLQIGWSAWALDPAGMQPPQQLDEIQVTQLSADSLCALE